ncbi:MAG: TRAP transporter small permease [Dehalococcoidales bacterium]|nr:TRAP transporter small permease [Dehalococcoidales bacterium]
MVDRLDKIAKTFSKWVSWVAGLGVVSMLALTVADVIGVKLFKSPIPGAIETVAFLGVVITAFSIAYTQSQRAHIQVDFFVIRLPGRIRAGVVAFTSLLGIILFALLSWQSFEYGCSLWAAGEVSMTSRIPFYPFVYAIAFCCIPVCLVLLVELLKSVMKVAAK